MIARDESAVPVGPEPQEPRPIAYAAKNTDLLLADAAERSRAAEWPWDMWCRICHIRPTSHRTEAEALEAADRHVKLCHAPQTEVHRLMTAGGLAEFERLRARVAELEAERHTTNEALSDAAETLRANRDQIAELENARTGSRSGDHSHPQTGDVSPQQQKLRALLAGQRATQETDPGRRAAYRMLAEPEPEFHAYLHHDYRDPHDRPETGGAGRD